MRRDMRRILSLAGWDVSTGIPQDGDFVGVWGRTPTAWRGEAVAGWTDSPILTVEDAFLRSVHPGRVKATTPAGLCLDRTGVHFDSSEPSDLEKILATAELDDTTLLNRAKAAIEQLKYWHLGKYSATDPTLEVPEPGYVLVIDQSEGDAALCGAGKSDFEEMLVAAADENPGTRILVKTHPETPSGARKGHFNSELKVDRAEIFGAPVSPWNLLDGAVGVYTHSSTLGFEAIFAGHKPRVFGTPFYAGWERTVDEQTFPRRGRNLTRAQLFAAAMILYPTWYDPISDSLCEVEDVISSLAAQSRAYREDRPGYVAAGFRRWKRPFMRRTFGAEKSIKFVSSAPAAVSRARSSGQKSMSWGVSDVSDIDLQMEDGFLRSRGLGASLVSPLSLVIDDEGIYFDPSKLSRLDKLISQSDSLPLAEIQRSQQLIGRINQSKLTKYNVGGDPKLDVPNRKKILVVGQVEDDASITFGAPEINTNLGLLRRVREQNPEACIIWKPHPDVEAGLRAGAVDDTDLSGLADMALTKASAVAAIDLADEVWTISSTLGFEALLRRKPVTCLGLPFYAGWGLTTDALPAPEHRGFNVTLEGLAHAVLIGYPRYFHPQSGKPISPEQAVWLLENAKDEIFAPVRGNFVQQLRGWLNLRL